MRTQVPPSSESNALPIGMNWSPEQQEVVDAINGYLDAWNREDAELVASFCDEDCDRINARGQVFRGRSAIYELYRRFFADPNIERRLTYEIISGAFPPATRFSSAALPSPSKKTERSPILGTGADANQIELTGGPGLVREGGEENPVAGAVPLRGGVNAQRATGEPLLVEPTRSGPGAVRAPVDGVGRARARFRPSASSRERSRGGGGR
ncbi:SgcJ/EcaC family oxidoreductase [Acidobacteria bacterium AH-259-O06]|nr:SgcJ/EcaC family oxidoreductase [Acidobacteria bacterium AH-259-O06]